MNNKIMTYKDIQNKYRSQYGTTIKTCWIADVKRQMGFNVRDAANKQGEDIKNKCPTERIDKIKNIIINGR